MRELLASVTTDVFSLRSASKGESSCIWGDKFTKKLAGFACVSMFMCVYVCERKSRTEIAQRFEGGIVVGMIW